MKSKQKFWLILLVLLIPHIFYSLTLLDALLSYYLDKNFFIFSYPFYILFQPINYLLGNPEGLGFALILGNLAYPIYSLLVFIITIIFTWRSYRSTRRIYPSYIVATVLIILLPLFVFFIGNKLSYASYGKENQQLLEEHNSLTVSVLPADVVENEMVIPIIVRGLKPENESYYFEVMLREKDSDYGSLESVRFNANYINSSWEYKSIYYPTTDDIEQKSDTIFLHFPIDSDIYNKGKLEILVDISLDFNKFYSNQFNVEAKKK